MSAALGESVDRLKERLTAIEFDLGGSLLAFRQQLLIERKLADDRHEMKRFDALDAAMHSLAVRHVANGSGNGHA